MTTTFTIIPERLAMLPDLEINAGWHYGFESGHCALELAAWLAGEEHSDSPECVCPVIASFVLSWNDSLASDSERGRLLGPLLPQLVGTRSTKEVEDRRSWLAMDWLVRVCVPTFLDLVPALQKHASTIRELPPVLSEDAAENARRPLVVSRDGAADWGAYDDAAMAATRAAASDAAGAAALTANGDATRSATTSTARSAARNAARAVSADALVSVVAQLQDSAVGLLERMIKEQDK